ncbi:MAG: PAS domain S-box protein [Candidatus Thorarchaeota archaeon]|nr:MAG: PAS domain S-box protein [Candidatus Thorarchaeota archaeon]
MTVRVLMVDDDSVHLELSEHFLNRQSPDFEIISVETGEEAIKLLEVDSLDAVVCDIDLAKDTMSGLDILEHIRNSGDDVPVIIFTGKSREEFAIQALNLGADYYILKSSTNIEGLYAELSYYILTAVEKRNTKIALRESESKLRQSQKRLAEAQRIAHSGSWVWNIEEDREIWSDEIYRIFGLAPQEFSATYEAFLDSVHPEDRELVKNSVDAAIHKKEQYKIDHRIIRPDGTIRFVHEEGEVTYSDDGKPVQMMGTVQDITERVRVETQLRDERDKAQRYLDLSGTMILALDTEFNITMINRKGCEMLDCNGNEVTGKNWVESFVPERFHADVYGHLTKLLQREYKEGPCCNFTIITRSGEEKIIQCQDTAICDKQGNVTTILCSAQLRATALTEIVQDDTLLIRSTQDRENWWKDAFERSPVAIGIFDSEGLLIDANKAAVELLGVKERENLLGLSLFKDSRLPEKVLENLKKGEVSRFRYKWDFTFVKERSILDTSRTDIVYMDVVLSSLEESKGEMMGYVLYATDYTERQKTENAIKENEEMFRTIFEESPICIELFDSDGLLVGANKKCLEVFGISGREDIIGFDVFADPNTPEYVKDEVREGNTAVYDSRFDFSKVKIHNMYETSKSGIKHLNSVFSPLKYGEGDDLQGFIIHVQDNTDKYLAEQALMESHESYKELYNHALIGLFRVRISDGRILECNDQFANSFGYENRQVLIDGSSFFNDFLQGTDAWNRLKGTIKAHERLVTESVVITKDSKQLWMRFALRIWPDKGYIEGVMADITQEKYAIEMLRKQKEELSDFAHSMNHDLKNILHNMQGFLELVEDENDFSHLKRIQSLIKETVELLDHSVALADAGLTVEKNLVEVDLDRLVRLIAESTVPELIEYVQDPLPVVRADEMKIIQVFRNLLDNAVKHGQPSKIEVKYEERNGTFCIMIRNDGKEIPEAIRSKLFFKGFTTSRSGQGFGLTIAKRIVEAHNWKIQFASARMTTFELIIPRQTTT